MKTISATRMNLLLKKEEVRDAATGADLLRNKRDVLLNEFFSSLRPLMTLRKTLGDRADEATRSLVLALGLEGREKLDSFSFKKQQAPGLEITQKNLLGLKIPEITVKPGGDGAKELPDVGTALVIEEAKEKFGEFLKLALTALSQELKLKRLGSEIRATTRKVNSLEKFVIPLLYSQVKFVQEALEEREREEVFRLKRLKGRLTG